MGNHKLSGQLRFDVEALLSVAPKYSQASGWVDNGVRDAANILLGLGQFWGADEAGTNFGTVYQAQQDMILKILGVLAGELAGIEAGIRMMAKNYGVTEDGLSARVRKLNSEF